MSFERSLSLCLGLLVVSQRELLRNQVLDSRKNVLENHNYGLFSNLVLPTLNVGRFEFLYPDIDRHLFKALLIDFDSYQSL